MCIYVFLGADHPLPLVDRDPDRPGFFVADPGAALSDVRRWLRQPFVYYLGSREECGDGFEFGVYPVLGEEDQEREARGRADVEAMARYLRLASAGGPICLYVQDEGAIEPVHRDARLEDFGGDSFSFEGNALITLFPDATHPT